MSAGTRRGLGSVQRVADQGEALDHGQAELRAGVGGERSLLDGVEHLRALERGHPEVLVVGIAGVPRAQLGPGSFGELRILELHGGVGGDAGVGLAEVLVPPARAGRLDLLVGGGVVQAAELGPLLAHRVGVAA